MAEYRVNFMGSAYVTADNEIDARHAVVMCWAQRHAEGKTQDGRPWGVFPPDVVVEYVKDLSASRVEDIPLRIAPPPPSRQPVPDADLF